MEKAVDPLKELLTGDINRGQLKVSSAVVGPQLGGMRGRGDRQVGRCSSSTHRDSPILAGKSGVRVEAVVERKDASLAGKQTVGRKEEQLNARQAEIRERRQGSEWLRKSVVDGEVHWKAVRSVAADPTVDVFFPLAGLDWTGLDWTACL